jgi:hypothetical protein
LGIDWRSQFVTTLVEPLPAAYPGGPAHEAGSLVAVSSIVDSANGHPIAFTAPSTAALALAVAARAARSAEAFRREFRFTDGVGPNGPVRMFEGTTAGQLFDYFEHCFVATVFSVQALEAYSNYKIAMTLDRPYKLERKGALVEMPPEDVERQASLDEKLGTILPELLGVQSPKGRAEWGAYVHLRRLRDATVHIKSHHQWTLADRDFESSPYSRFIEESALSIPGPAIRLLAHFAVAHEKEWLSGTEAILAT